MRSSIALLVLCAVVAVKAQFQYAYQYPAYQYPVIVGQQPQNYIADSPQNRLFFGNLITTTTSTSTSTITCTVSTTACTGRRKRFLVGDVEEDIQASAVNPVEATQIADGSERQAREANPQLNGFWNEHPTYEIQPTLGQPQYYPGYNYGRQPVVAADGRFLFGKITLTSTTITTTTSTSRPGCSSASGFSQC